MKRLMIIPAAGRGSRLQTTLPKILYPVAQRVMVDYLFDLYHSCIQRFVLVLHPSFAKRVQDYCDASKFPVDYVLQGDPTGMVDALLLARDLVVTHKPQRVWISWCDQIAIQAQTVDAIIESEQSHPNATLIVPTISKTDPYIHIVRDADGKIADVLHRREGDVMPDEGEGDMGLFSLSFDCYRKYLFEFAAGAPQGSRTAETNFLPFLPWVQQRDCVYAIEGTDPIESIGVNDREDLEQVERFWGES